jgi:hypothetical protein
LRTKPSRNFDAVFTSDPDPGSIVMPLELWLAEQHPLGHDSVQATAHM